MLLTKRDEKISNIKKSLKQSYHDDAALIENNDLHTVLSTDMLIEHSHFPKEMTAYQIGLKSITVNVSDIIAMNAKPTSILISMGLPPSMTISQYQELIQGILDGCEKYDITLIGGDINQSNEIIISGTSIGEIDNNFKLQYEIKEGDLIALSGPLGGPAAALDLLNSDKEYTETEKTIIKTLLEPDIPFETFKTLHKYPELVNNITDITDGLAVELGHLNDKNKKIGFEIDFDKIPYDKNIEKVAEENNKSLEDYLLHFGEEFELLLIIDYDKYDEEKLDNVYIIGKTDNSGEITLIKNNTKNKLITSGYEHFRED